MVSDKTGCFLDNAFIELTQVLLVEVTTENCESDSSVSNVKVEDFCCICQCDECGQ